MQELEQQCGSGDSGEAFENQVARARCTLACMREHARHHSATWKAHEPDELMKALISHALPPAVSAVTFALRFCVPGVLPIVKVLTGSCCG